VPFLRPLSAPGEKGHYSEGLPFSSEPLFPFLVHG